MNKFNLKYILILIFLPLFIAATNFEELDKPPEGAYKGQMFFGSSLSMGFPIGSIIDAEKDFVDGSTYTFTDSETIKKIEVAHLAFGFGIFGEYMPIDYVGAKSQLHYSYIVQRSRFGADYKNEKGALYKDYSLLLGPVFHATYRKPWDITLHPFFGIAYSTFEATPVAKQLIDDYDPSTSNTYTSFVFGAELNGTIYFSGGLFISLGFKWIRNTIKLSKAVSDVNPQTNNEYLDGGTSGTIDSIHLMLQAGYAFYN